MRLKRAIKRIVALGTGVTMVGATLLGAMAAADLSDYPAPFISEGEFNALVVVGAAAKTDDVLGAIDIATSLQYANTVTKTVPGTGTTVSVVGEGVKIATDSNNLIIGEALQTVKSNLDEDDLPTLLAEGTFVNDGDDESTEYEYKQKLEFGTGDNASVSWVRDRDYDLDEENPHVLLYGPKSSGTGATKGWFMRYTLDFQKDADSDLYTDTTCGSANELCDIEDTKIEMMGIEYEVTKAEYVQATNVLTWEMMGGVSLNTMYEGETKTFTVNGVDYEVTVDIISDTGSADETVILTVNGESTKELSQDQTQKVAGIEVGIKQVMGNEAGEAGAGRDLVQFYLGAQKVVLTDSAAASATTLYSNNVKLGGTDVDDLYVDWVVTEPSNAAKLDKLMLTWLPTDELFVSEDNPVTFPGLGALSVEYAGMTHEGEEEEIIFEPNGDQNIQLTAPLENGVVSVDVLYLESTVTGGNFTAFGEYAAVASRGRLFTDTAFESGLVYEGDYILLSDSTERESHIVELDKVTTQNVTTLKNLADGTKYEGTCTGGCTIGVGDLDVVFSDVSNAAGTATLSGGDVTDIIYTKEGLTIDLNGASGAPAATATNTHTFIITEENDQSTLSLGGTFNVTAGVTGTSPNLKAHISDVDEDGDAWETAANQAGTKAWQYASTKDWGYMSDFGTLAVWDKSGDEYLVTITYPGEEAHANVFVNSESAVVTEGSGGGTYDEVQRVDVGAAVLDTEVASLEAQNTIVVGGPCVNSLAAELMGNPAVCTEGFEMGKAMIKLFEHDNENVALLVAGYSAMDSRRAARVVANYDSYDNFAGTELEVTGTSLTDISVGVPTPAEEPEAEVDADAGAEE